MYLQINILHIFAGQSDNGLNGQLVLNKTVMYTETQLVLNSQVLNRFSEDSLFKYVVLTMCVFINVVKEHSEYFIFVLVCCICTERDTVRVYVHVWTLY